MPTRFLATLFAASLLAAAACGGPLEDVPPLDDDHSGDSLAPGATPGDSDGSGGGGKADGYGVPKSLGLDKRHVLYLSFDDGPSAALTPHVLDVLARHHAHAIFFLTGLNLAGNEALVRRELAEGHLIGNHQWKHVVATPAEFAAWVPRERDALRAIAGPTPRYFRYPYGAMTSAKEVVLRRDGYPDGGVGWDIDSLDWSFGASQSSTRPEVPPSLRHDFEGWVVSQAVARGGGVILFHDIQSITGKHLDSILGKLAAKGFRFGELPRTGR